MSLRLKPMSWSLPIQRMRSERVAAVEAVATLRTGRGREEAELFVEVDRADRLARFSREIADLHQIPSIASRVERRHRRRVGRGLGLDGASRRGAAHEWEAVVVGHGGSSSNRTCQSYVHVTVCL